MVLGFVVFFVAYWLFSGLVDVFLFCLVVPCLQLLARGFLLCSLDALLEGVPFLDALLADVDRYKGV